MKYEGEELGLFAEARNWKKTLRRQMNPFLTGNILEVGAGVGGTTEFLMGPSVKRLVCLEPDSELAERITSSRSDFASSSELEVIVGAIDDVPEAERFDAIVYIDVLEHIADDEGEVEKAAMRLCSGGSLIIVSPAHQFLYSPFDKAIGHYRRYTLQMLEQIRPKQLAVARRRYLDSVGFLASLANRLLLRQKMPTSSQLEFWDRWMVRLSRLFDPLLAYRFGKSVIVVWKSP